MSTITLAVFHSMSHSQYIIFTRDKHPGSKSTLIRGTRRNFLRGGANNPLRRCSKVVSEMKRLSMPSEVEQLDIMD